MQVSKVRWDYDQLSEIVQTFLHAAETVSAVSNTLKQQMEVLQHGDWSGAGAQAFFAEMNNKVLPAYARLLHSFSESSRILQQVIRLCIETEETASRLLQRMNQAKAMADMAMLGAAAAIPAPFGSPFAALGVGIAANAMFTPAGANGNFQVSSRAQSAPNLNHFNDRTPTNDIKITKDGNGDVKVFSYKANMNVDSDGPTSAVLNESDNAAIRQRHGLPNNVSERALVARNQAAESEIAAKEQQVHRKLNATERLNIKQKHGLLADKTDNDLRTASRRANQEIADTARQQGKFYDFDKQDRTAYTWSNGQNLNPAEVPYISVPPEFLKDHGGYINKGDLVLVRHGNDHVYAIVGDVGNPHLAGEASMKTAGEVSPSNSPSRGGFDERDQSVQYIVLPGSGNTYNPNRNPKTFSEIQTAGEAAFQQAKTNGLVD